MWVSQLTAVPGENGKESEPAQFWGLKGFTVSQLWGEGPKKFTLRTVVQVPEGYGKTGAVKIQDLSLFVAEDRFWLEHIKIYDNSSESVQPTMALAESWVCKAQSWRTIFVNTVMHSSLQPDSAASELTLQLLACCQAIHDKRLLAAAV